MCAIQDVCHVRTQLSYDTHDINIELRNKFLEIKKLRF
jgi:hypothetical protein